MPPKISLFTLKKVRQRAEFLCEYCHSIELWQLIPFTIDHIIPISKGGINELENLALACFHCNRHKSDKQFINEIPIFNPRKMKWNEHFSWSEDFIRIIPKTETGRITIQLLKLNRPRICEIRAADVLIKRHPPQSDLD